MFKTLEELDLCDNFLFCEVMKNKDICNDILGLILNVKIKDITSTSIHDFEKFTYDGRAVQLDVLVEDEENTLYNVERSV